MTLILLRVTKIAAAIYQDQVDNGGKHIKMYFGFVSSTVEIVKPAANTVIWAVPLQTGLELDQ